jgi:hypothetical protein
MLAPYYHSVQNLWSPSLLSKDITVIVPAILYGCEAWSLTFRKEWRD